VAGDRHGGAPKGERVGRGFARRDPRVTRAAHTRACRRDNDNKKAPVGAPPTLRFGGHEAKVQNPGAAMRVRERDGLFDIVNFESAAVHGSRELGGYPPHPEEGA
jgi:hypothetical protein